MNISPTLAHGRAGSGEPLVLVHPLGTDRGVWDPVMDPLSARHDVIALDMPGHGDSPETPADTAPTPEEIARRIAATLDELGVAQSHMAGISLGGWVALEFAKTDRCLSVTGLCPAGFWPRPLGPRPEVARGTARRLLPFARALMQTARGRRLALRGTVAKPDRVPPAAAHRMVRAYALSPGFARANAEMRRTLFSGFEDIDVPITLAWAEFDRSVAPPRAGVPDRVHTEFLGGCGHVPTWDDPDKVASTILDTTRRASALRT